MLVGLSPRTTPFIRHNRLQYPSLTSTCQEFSDRQTLPGSAAYLPNSPRCIQASRLPLLAIRRAIYPMRSPIGNMSVDHGGAYVLAPAVPERFEQLTIGFYKREDFVP